MHYVNEKLDSGNTIIQKFFIDRKDNETEFKKKDTKIRIHCIS